MIGRLVLLLTALSLGVTACTAPRDQYDYIGGDVVTMTASTLDAGVGEAVILTFTGSFELDAKSRVPQRTVSDISLGMCFTHGFTAVEEVFIDPHGFCEGKPQTLPPNYQLLDNADYYTTFDNVIVERGERRTFEHSFTFTSTEADELTLVPTFAHTDEPSPVRVFGSLAGRNFPVLTFK